MSYYNKEKPKLIVIIMNLILIILIGMIVLFVVKFISVYNENNTHQFDNIYALPDPPSTSDSSEPNIENSVDASSDVDENSSDESNIESSVSSTDSSEPIGDYSTMVPESERVFSSYFDDAVFLGDSLTEGIKLYDIMSNTTVISYTGLNLQNIYTGEYIEIEDGTKITVMEAFKATSPKKIYILLGANSIAFDVNTFTNLYGKIIDDAKEYHPDAIIYLQSMLPVTKVNKYNLDNATIDEYNLALLELAVEKEVYYLDVNSYLKDDSGALPTEASPSDGMHFGPTYYQKWFDYLKTHTADGSIYYYTEN